MDGLGFDVGRSDGGGIFDGVIGIFWVDLGLLSDF
jgi:hypothetical protein